MTNALCRRLDRIEQAHPGDTLLLALSSPGETVTQCLHRNGVDEATAAWRRIVIVDTGIYR